MNLKILTYNIHKGLDWFNRKLVLSRIKAFIISNQADIVFLQEVVGENSHHKDKFEDYPDAGQYEYLADSIWKDYAYAKNAIYENRHHGNVILSKFPIEITDVENISTNKFEQRGVLYCKVKLMQNDVSLHLFCVHLNIFHIGRKKQYEKIQNIISKKCNEKDSIILAGDFNDWNMKANSIIETDLIDTYKFVHGHYAKTFPAIFPFVSLDRIYTKNLEILSSVIPNHEGIKGLSDHKPLIAEVRVIT